MPFEHPSNARSNGRHGFSLTRATARIYYLDGEKHKRKLPNGDEMESFARQRGEAIEIEEKSERAEIEREYELSPDGETMVVTMSVKTGRMLEPVLIRSVYERGELFVETEPER